MMKTRHLLILFTLALALALLWLLGAALVPAAHADPDTICVATTGSDTAGCGGTSTPCRTVQYAVGQALSGDTILVAGGVYSDIHFDITDGVTQVVRIDKSLTIKGGYTTTNWITPDPEAYPTILDAQEQGRVIYITRDVTVTLEGLRILNGAAEKGGGSYPSYESGGGIFSAARALTIRDSTVMSNTAFTDHDSYSLAGRGGGIYQDCAEGTGLCAYTPAFRVEDSRFLSNTAEYDGGGIYLYGSDAVLEDITFTGNRAWYNGGGLVSSGGSLTIRNSDLAHNQARDNLDNAREGGGGIYVNGSAPVMLENNTFITNTADMGGGLFVRDATLTMTNNLLQDNLAHHYAGGATIYQCDAYVADNTFEGNVAKGWGGGLEATWGDLTITHNTFRDNTGGEHGGGFYGGGLHDGHTYTITYNLFQGNVAAPSGSGTGGGARILNGSLGENGWIVFSHNQVLDNVASAGPTGANGGRGGGVHITGPALVSHNLFQNNWANSASPQGGYYYGGYGGGLYLMGDGLIVDGNRFLDNRAARNAGYNYTSEAFGGAAYVAPYGTVVTMTNNLLAGNRHCEECTSWFSEWYRGGGAVAVEGGYYASPPDTYLYFYHNTLVGNQSSAVRNGEGASIVMSHNLFSNHDTDVLNARMYDYVCPVTVLDYTLWWPGKGVRVDDIDDQCSPPLTTHDFTGDPELTADNYHLGSGSAAIDRGPGVDVTTDIDGHPRPIGTGYDLGADEYTGVDLSSSHKSAAPDEVAPGGTVTFTIVMRNDGTLNAPDVSLYDSIPISTTYVPGSAWVSSGTVSDTDGIRWCGSLPAGGAVTLTFRATVSTSAPIKNTAVLSDGYGTTLDLIALVNGRRVYLPLVVRSYAP